jgi:hypothetical protein
MAPRIVHVHRRKASKRMPRWSRRSRSGKCCVELKVSLEKAFEESSLGLRKRLSAEPFGPVALVRQHRTATGRPECR